MVMPEVDRNRRGNVMNIFKRFSGALVLYEVDSGG